MTPAKSVSAIYYDGLSAKVFAAKLTLVEVPSVFEDAEAVLHIKTEEHKLEWPLNELEAIENAVGTLQISLIHGQDLEAIEVKDKAFWAYIKNHTQVKKAGNAERNRKLRKFAPWVLGGVASLLFLFFVGIPLLSDTIVEVLPPSVDERIGKSALPQIKTVFTRFGGSKNIKCSTDEGHPGNIAINKLANQLANRMETPFEINVEVLATRMPNAFALPGGYILLTSGIIDIMENSDELAAVMAHEIAHVKQRHSMRIVTRAAGSAYIIGMVLGDVTGGGAMAVALEQLTNMSYTRQYEREADDLAFKAMKEQGRKPEALGTLFEKLIGSYREYEGAGSIIPDWLRTHPAMKERIERSKELSKDMDASGKPIMTNEEWKAIKSICIKNKNRDKNNDEARQDSDI